MEIEAIKLLSAALCIAVGATAACVTQSQVAKKTMETIGRNPEIGDSVFTKLIVTMALLESSAIYCLVVSLIILFVA